MITRALVLLLIFVVTLIKGAMRVTGQLECTAPIPNGNKVAVNAILNPAEKTVSGSLFFNESICDASFHAYFHKCADGHCKYNETELDGPLCETVDVFVKDAWTEFSNFVKPPMDLCKCIAAGLYEFKNSYISSVNLDHLVGMEGTWIMEFIMLKDDEPFTCIAAELIFSGDYDDLLT